MLKENVLVSDSLHIHCALDGIAQYLYRNLLEDKLWKLKKKKKPSYTS